MDGTRSLVSNDELMLYGVIDTYAYEGEGVRAIDVIDSLGKIQSKDEVVVRINSPGGSVTEGVAIYNALRADRRKIIVKVDAMAASIASVIAMAGDEIIMAENASIMIHDPWAMAIGSSGEMRKMADEIDRLKGIILDIYEKRTGMARAEIESLMAAETYFSASDAVERGFASSVEMPLAVAACAPLEKTVLARLLLGSAPIRSAEQPASPAAPAAPQLEDDMSNTTQPAGAQNAAVIDESAVRAEAARAERERVQGIHAAVRNAKLDAALADKLVTEGVDLNTASARIIEAWNAKVSAEAGPETRPSVTVTQDSTETARAAMEEALAIRLGAGGTPSDAARNYMDFSIVDMAAERTGHRGRLSVAAVRENVVRNAMHTTSDFPILLENALNRALQARYALAQPTYRSIAKQRTYVDFRDHISVRAGDFPQMQPVAETGEIKGGTFSESKEKTAVKAYGVQVGFSRQLLVNDSLGAINDVLTARADAVARFEEETFYAMMLAASGAGPTLLETSRAVFNTTDKTLAASATTIDAANIALGRAALRKMKTKDGTLINVSPSILLCGPDREFVAEQLLSPIAAAQTGNVNPFSGKLSLIVSGQITDNSWYLFVDPSVVANFEWGLLEGYTAPRMRMDEPFGQQGMKVSLEHDFGCGAVNFRGGYRNAGA